MSKLNYKPIAVQNECWGGSQQEPEVTVLVKMMAQWKNKKYYKNDAISFPNAKYLDEYISENAIEIIPEKDFKSTPTEKAIHLIEALK